MESGRHPSPEDPLGGGSQILGAILAACTVGIPLIAVLSFSTPPRLIDLKVNSLLTDPIIVQEEASVTRFQRPFELRKP
ncbi:MAG: hypothetical protein HC795_00925 [Coleofasciculaceae cyanobacterium RL_1_1]|nr:hypothetical protein [Coleofasciculaceae cyanobacterium RL_1_1]